MKGNGDDAFSCLQRFFADCIASVAAASTANLASAAHDLAATRETI